MSIEAMKMAPEALEDVQEAYGNHSKWFKDRVDALRQAIEQAEQQEPVTWRDMAYANLGAVRDKMPPEQVTAVQDWLEKVYTAPPKREWVGLTDEQVEDEWERITGHSIFGGDRSEGRAMYISPDEVIEFFRAIEAKLKAKNA